MTAHARLTEGRDGRLYLARPDGRVHEVDPSRIHRIVSREQPNQCVCGEPIHNGSTWIKILKAAS